MLMPQVKTHAAALAGCGCGFVCFRRPASVENPDAIGLI